MGFWKSERGISGDSWADEMGRCMEALQKMRVQYIETDPMLANVAVDDEQGEHEITMAEFADLIEFCSRGHLSVEVRYPEADGERPLSQLHSNAVQTYPNCGQIHWKELARS